MYTLKSIAQRGTLLGTAAALVLAAVLPSAAAFADALNPLTNRSLTLSSSAPGWDKTDGSGNATYAMPNSGANGFKTGNTFAFNVSTNSTGTPLQGFSFQYCTASAGNCTSPGDNGYVGTAGAYTGVNPDSATTSNLNVATSSPSEVSGTSLFNTTTGEATNIPNRDDTQGNFIVLTQRGGAGAWTQVSGWTMSAANKEDGTLLAGTKTGANNYITLTNASSSFEPLAGDPVKVVFFGTNGNYITNPGSGAFFVKINDYSDAALTTTVDGGVTVANVMNQSIEIQTKVLETMDFSVGTVDPTTLSDAQLSAATSGGKTTHGPCDGILQGMLPTDEKNTLQLGDTLAENSLRTDTTYSTHSYWRLSSNSSAGATVYYSGVTLSNTVGDQIDAIHNGDGVSDAPHVGSEQFGLALANGTLANNPQPLSTNPGSIHAVDYGVERTAGKVYENAADNVTSGVDASTTTELTTNASYHSPRLYPLIPGSNYDSGAGTVNNNYSSGSDPINTKFAFDTASNLTPTPIATEGSQVVDCVTGKMRYIANIAATTPAGIYTTKINYIAAPQY